MQKRHAQSIFEPVRSLEAWPGRGAVGILEGPHGTSNRGVRCEVNHRSFPGCGRTIARLAPLFVQVADEHMKERRYSHPSTVLHGGGHCIVLNHEGLMIDLAAFYGKGFGFFRGQFTPTSMLTRALRSMGPCSMQCSVAASYAAASVIWGQQRTGILYVAAVNACCCHACILCAR